MSRDIIKARRKTTFRKNLVDWVAVGRRIRELRGFDVTQEQLAVTIGVSQGHLSYMERGEKEIGAEILLRISSEFGKSIEWLLLGDDKIPDSRQ